MFFLFEINDSTDAIGCTIQIVNLFETDFGGNHCEQGLNSHFNAGASQQGRAAGIFF